jgi:hypothetical protein
MDEEREKTYKLLLRNDKKGTAHSNVKKKIQANLTLIIFCSEFV